MLRFSNSGQASVKQLFKMLRKRKKNLKLNEKTGNVANVSFVYETRSQAMMSFSLFGCVGLAKRAAIFRSFRYNLR
jgi:hypothetical protein